MKRFKGVLRFKLEPGTDVDEFVGRLKALVDEGKEKMGGLGLIDAIVWRPGEATESEYDVDVEFLWRSREHQEKLREMRESGAAGAAGPGMIKFLAIVRDPVVSERALEQYIEY